VISIVQELTSVWFRFSVYISIMNVDSQT